jgi:transposase
MSMSETHCTPKDVAGKFGVSEEVVWSWLNSGELAGTNVARSGCKKRRWKISETAIVAFEASRSSAKPVPVKPVATPQRGRKPTPGLTKFV